MKDLTLKVESNIPLKNNIFLLKLKSLEKLPKIHCGQFTHIELKDKTMPLRRPFCVYDFDDYSITLMIAVVGKGTKCLQNLVAGEQVKAILPIGNGFTLSENHKKIAIVGGGVGIAPLYKVPHCYPDKEYRSYLGFANKNSVMLEKEFNAFSKVLVSTDDGSYGYKGYVTEAFENDLVNFKPDVVITCGSENMLKSLAKITLKHGIPAYMSGESRMACGVGACLVCACAIKQANGEVHNMRACVDGPVFKLEDIIL